MNLLLVEDDEHKRRRILDYLAEAFPMVTVKQARSYQSGLRAIIAEPPNLVLLDMTMPTFDVTVNDNGGRPQHFAGRDILRQLEARGLSTKCVVVTQFDRFGDEASAVTAGQLGETLAREHPTTYLSMVTFDITVGTWKEALGAVIRRVQATGDVE